MENLFKKAQNAGIQLEKQAAVEEIREGSVDTSPDTHYYENSKAGDKLDLDGAFRGLLKLSENYTKNEVNEEYVQGRLAAQTGKALEEGASPWTERGYKSFQMSSNIHAFVGNTIGNMDKFAEESPAVFQQYLEESYQAMNAAEDDEFLKEQLTKMYTNVSGNLIQQHTKAREQLHQQKTINAARENIVNALHSEGGVVKGTVLNTINATKAALPEKVAYGVIADASYVSMIANGDVSLYEHLRDNDYFRKLDEPTRTQLDRAYNAIKDSKAKAGAALIKKLDSIQMVQEGRIGHNDYLTSAEKNAAMNDYFDEVKQQYAQDPEGTAKYISDIIETSIKNDWYSHGGASTIQNYITSPVMYTEGKPTIREESLSAIVAAAQTKQKYGARGDLALSKFLDEDSRTFLDLIDMETAMGIAAASPDDLRTAVSRVYDSYARRDKIDPAIKNFSKTSEYSSAIKSLDDNIKNRFGEGFFSSIDTWFRANNDRVNPWYKIKQDMGEVTDSAQLRGLPAKNPDDIRDAFDKQLIVEMGHANNPEIAAKFAANKIARRTHNILGNYIMYDAATAQMDTVASDGEPSTRQVGVSLPALFGLDPADNDDDISEALGSMLLETSEGKTRSALKKHLTEATVTLNPERQTLRVKFNYDARTLRQAAWLPIMNLFSANTSEEYEEAQLARDAMFDLEIPIEKIREYNVAKLAKERQERVNIILE